MVKKPGTSKPLRSVGGNGLTGSAGPTSLSKQGAQQVPLGMGGYPTSGYFSGPSSHSQPPCTIGTSWEKITSSIRSWGAALAEESPVLTGGCQSARWIGNATVG